MPYTMNIEYEIDTQFFNPREDDNLGTMACFHSRYRLGDDLKEVLSVPDLWATYGTEEEQREVVCHSLKNCTLEDAKYNYRARYGNDWAEWIACEELTEHPSKNWPDAVIALPLFLYDHSGITMNTGGFSCPWDSGCVGYIYVTRDTLAKEGLADKTDEEIADYLRGEVSVYDQYLTGDIWYYSITDTETGEVVDSCGGIFGYEYAEEEAQKALEYFENAEKEHAPFMSAQL